MSSPFLGYPIFSWPAAPFGLLYTFSANSSTPKTTYTDPNNTVPNINPVELDATGSAIVRLGSGSYKFVLLDQGNTVTLWEADFYDSSAQTQSSLGALLYPQTNAEAAAFVTPSSPAQSAITVSVFRYFSAVQIADVLAGTLTQDVTAAILQGVASNPGGSIFCPAGSYKISGAGGVTILNGCSLYGVYGRSTFVLATHNMNGVVFGDGTSGTRNGGASVCSIQGITFNPLNGVAAFTAGSCIVRNNVFQVHVNNCIAYGKDATANKLWNFLTDISTTDCDANGCGAIQILNNVVNVSGASGALASDNFYNYLRYNNIGGDALFVGPFIGGLTFTNPTGYFVLGWHFHMNSSTGNNGQNVFVTAPDFEVDGLCIGGAYVEQGNGVSFSGDGWIGAGASQVCLWFGVNASNCKSNEINYFGGKILIDGPDNYVTGGNVTGNSVTSATAFLVSSTAIFGSIGGGIKIQQYITSAIAFSGTPPALNFKVDAQFNAIGSNATEITGIASSPNNGPDCRGCTTAASAFVTAAAALPLNFGNEFIQVTGATAITSMTVKSKGTIQMIQAGAGGITINNTAVIVTLSGSNLSLSAFKVAGFVCDGAAAWVQVF